MGRLQGSSRECKKARKAREPREGEGAFKEKKGESLLREVCKS